MKLKKNGVSHMVEVYKEIRACTDPDVLNGHKFCFCCVPTCRFMKVMSADEFDEFLKMVQEDEAEIKLKLEELNGKKEEE